MTTRKPIEKHKLIQRIALSGLSHHEYAFYAKSIQPGTELLLVADVGNPYDQFAVKVGVATEAEDFAQIGWIPKGQNEMLFRLINAGVEIRCKVISHEAYRPLTTRLYIANYVTVLE